MTLLADAVVIRDETIPGANTALRVGTVLENIVNGTIITPPNLGADANDYNPAGLADATVIRQAASGGGGGPRRITGIVAPPLGDNRTITIYSLGTKDLSLRDNDAGSIAANRFLLAADVTILVERSRTIWYDHIVQRWRLRGAL